MMTTNKTYLVKVKTNLDGEGVKSSKKKNRGAQALHAWDPLHKVLQGGKGSVWDWAPYVVMYVSYRKYGHPQPPSQYYFYNYM